MPAESPPPPPPSPLPPPAAAAAPEGADALTATGQVRWIEFHCGESTRIFSCKVIMEADGRRSWEPCDHRYNNDDYEKITLSSLHTRASLLGWSSHPSPSVKPLAALTALYQAASL